MKELITPEKIQNDLLIGDINKQEAAELLISLIEGSDSTEIRVQCIKILEDIDIYSEKIFKTLENCLISDENAIVRASVAKYIILNLLEDNISALRWVIQHDRSPLVLKIFFDISDNFSIDSLPLILLDDLLRWNKQFASNIGIVPEESKFFLDLEALFARGEKNYEIDPFCYTYFENLSDIKNSEPWLVIKDKHIELLNLNYFNWKYIKENQDIFDSLSRLKSLDLYLNSIRKYYYNNFDFTEIPASIGKLKSLRKLILKGNNLQRLPESIKKLTNLTELDLSYNNFQEIPQILKILKSLKKLNLKHNNIHEISESMKNFINSLVDFKL